MKWLVDFNTGKTQLVSFNQSNSTGAIDAKMDWSVLEKKSSFKMPGLTFCSKLDWCSLLLSQLSNCLQENWTSICSMKCLSPKFALYLYKSTILPYLKHWCHVWAGTPSCYWNCWISYKNGYTGLLALHLLLPLNSWLISEM